MRQLLLSALLLLPLTVAAQSGKTRVLTAEIAYAKPMQFDYDKDGKMNNIQMWAKIVIDKTDKGYEGYFRRFMKDVDTGKAVLGYADINMLPDQPYGEKLPVSQVEKRGRTVLFKAGSKHYILMDGGADYRSDTAIANDGNRDYIVELYDGDIKVTQ
ncbi:hypothetical protein [Sulfurovum riftiae]|uniref:Uncharacterized protein n=1 Tax=Sulfurovum riftiae TaxID=1630136 RepID=A0A151CJQ4_9BACT|nr:hypothetical protein [Sulfurovum riftiae]KYJ87664.1 hypothetical protein AS592_11265 [Sulfurovum riftiae]